MYRNNPIYKHLMIGCSLVAGITCGCERHMSGDDPPMRPLVYTELPPQEDTPEPEQVEPIRNIAPEDLGYGVFHALVEHNREQYESMFISAPALASLVRMPLDEAQQQTRAFLRKSEVLWSLFSPALEAENPVSGLSSRLKLAEFRVGKGRNLAGKIASPDSDELVQHWGNELRIELENSEKVFTIRIPKIVKTATGWRIAQAIELDKSLQLFLECGMHLSSDLLTSEHYPIPLEVGNYWKYRVTHSLGQEQNNGEPSESPSEPQDSTATDMITDIVHRDGYWVVSFERTFVDPETQTEGPEISRFSWLVTPRMIYPCMRDCRNNSDNIGYLLGYMARQTPIFVFPLEVGAKWSVSGQKDNIYKYEVRTLHSEATVVPAGSFTGAYEIFGSIEEGRESRFFVPGTGIVMRTVRGGVGQKREVLIKHRLIL